MKKTRKVVLTLEVETDATLKDLRKRSAYTIAVAGAAVDVVQAQANAVE